MTRSRFIVVLHFVTMALVRVGPDWEEVVKQATQFDRNQRVTHDEALYVAANLKST